MNEDISKYKDIIILPHHVSIKHRPMSMHDRAAQFAPFAALVGYDDKVRETARYTENKIDLNEEEKEQLDIKLNILKEKLNLNPIVTFIYFVPDSKKEGGRYMTVSGIIKKIDDYKNIIYINNVEIPINQIIDIDSDILNKMDL